MAAMVNSRNLPEIAITVNAVNCRVARTHSKARGLRQGMSAHGPPRVCWRRCSALHSGGLLAAGGRGGQASLAPAWGPHCLTSGQHGSWPSLLPGPSGACWSLSAQGLCQHFFVQKSTCDQGEPSDPTVGRSSPAVRNGPMTDREVPALPVHHLTAPDL